MKNRSVLRKILKVLGIVSASVSGIVLAAFAWYVITYYPRKIEPYEINTPDVFPHILIATQGSDFKNGIVAGLDEKFGIWPAYVKVVDVGSLDDIKVDDWQKIIILNTAMMNKLNGSVQSLIQRSNGSDNVLLLITSGAGDFKPEGLPVDALSGASRMVDTDRIVGMMFDWLGKDGSLALDPGDPVLAMEYLLQVDVAKSCAEVRNNPASFMSKYPSLEARLIRIGYDFYGRNKLRDALAPFCLAKDLFPESWNAYDSYAEALLANGETEAARVNFKKSLELNPANENAKKVLEKIETGNSG